MRKGTKIIKTIACLAGCTLISSACAPTLTSCARGEEALTFDDHVHIWSEWTTTVAPTCEQVGEETRVCLADGTHIQTREIPPRHEYGKDNACTVCGAALNYTRGLDCKLDESGSYYVVTGMGTCVDKEIVLPYYVDGLPIAAIGEGAFFGADIEDIILPETLRHIKSSAFYRCEKLTSLDIPDDVLNIDDEAFKGCKSVKSVTFGSSLNAIGKSAFADCFAIESAIMPDGVQSIGDYAFNFCTSLGYVKIGRETDYIGQYAFANCYNLSHVRFANGADWTISKNSTMTNSRILSISDTATNARHISSQFCECFWRRNDD